MFLKDFELIHKLEYIYFFCLFNSVRYLETYALEHWKFKH